MLKEVTASSLPTLFNAQSANQTMTGTNVLTSNPANVLYKDGVAIQCNWTGTPTGSFTVQGSIDYNPGAPQSAGAFNAGNWITINVVDVNGQSLAASGSAGNFLLNMNQVAWPWIRVLYTNATGTGVLTGYLSAKSLG